MISTLKVQVAVDLEIFQINTTINREQYKKREKISGEQQFLNTIHVKS